MAVDPGSPENQPFAADGGPVGVVLSHGFTGTPASVRPWAQFLADAGYTVRLPRLPGHGTTWRDANTTTWHDWYGAVEAAYDEVAARCSTVFGAGLSMGGTLITRLAEQKGDAISGIVIVNPSYATERADARLARYIAWALPSRPAIGNDIKKAGVIETAYDRTPVRAFVSVQDLWKAVRADFDKLTTPVLMFRSRDDHVVEPLSGRILQAEAKNTTVREVVLTDSYHVATLDNERQQIFDGSLDFFRSLEAAASASDVLRSEK